MIACIFRSRCAAIEVKFTFKNAAIEEEKKDESQEGATKKKAYSDSEEEEQDNEQKEKGISNKKKKLQRRMKITELKQICARPDVVEVWDATAADPKLLVFLKSYRNTVLILYLEATTVRMLHRNYPL